MGSDKKKLVSDDSPLVCFRGWVSSLLFSLCFHGVCVLLFSLAFGCLAFGRGCVWLLAAVAPFLSPRWRMAVLTGSAGPPSAVSAWTSLSPVATKVGVWGTALYTMLCRSLVVLGFSPSKSASALRMAPRHHSLPQRFDGLIAGTIDQRTDAGLKTQRGGTAWPSASTVLK